ncbi:uncharacterized protein [Epargyreus clarus]|uniref:uncharacterized protein isoform X2 n=1 Tax=Epargyreus clarus TaxID=520877 RepID=UPI003C2B2F4E
MDHPMTEEESYADRRQLFKNIWETAMDIDEKEVNVINKPKVIKTLRLDEVDRHTATKKKKQRIKNLRLVCNKLLDFCDRQDADDIYYEQMATNGRHSPTHTDEDHSQKKSRVTRDKRKTKKAKSLYTKIRPQARLASPVRRNEFLTVGKCTSSRTTSPMKYDVICNKSSQEKSRKRVKRIRVPKC